MVELPKVQVELWAKLAAVTASFSGTTRRVTLCGGCGWECRWWFIDQRRDGLGHHSGQGVVTFDGEVHGVQEPRRWLESTSRFAGHFVDIDQDGLDDILVGDGLAGSLSGEVYLFLGSSLGSNQNINVNNADYTFTGESFSSAGSHVSSAGDVDNDGIPDILISASTFELSPASAEGKVLL